VIDPSPQLQEEKHLQNIITRNIMLVTGYTRHNISITPYDEQPQTETLPAFLAIWLAAFQVL